MRNVKFGLCFAIFVVSSSCLNSEAHAQPHPTHNSAETRNLSVDAAMGAAVAQKAFDARLKYKEILFITNREIDASAEERARRGGSVLSLEDVFLKKPSLAAAYGRAEVSYPANRRRGDQNYLSGSTRQNPLFNPCVVGFAVVSTPNEFHILAEAIAPKEKPQPALLYVHGLDDSFSDAAERLAQLTVDLSYPGYSMLFSWPSDDWEWPFPTRSDYLHTVRLSRASRLYLVNAIGELRSLSGGPINVLAHSMGSDLAANALVIRDRVLRRDPSVPLEQTTLSLVLAAPDISTKEFNETLRPSLVQQQQMHIVVYCSADRALVVSRLYNQSDVRLGYCMPDPDASSNQNPRGAGPNHNSHEMPGVDLVTVRGEVRDFAHHSYYLSAVEILDDLQAIFGGGALDKIRAHSDGMMRTIQVR